MSAAGRYLIAQVQVGTRAVDGAEHPVTHQLHGGVEGTGRRWEILRAVCQGTPDRTDRYPLKRHAIAEWKRLAPAKRGRKPEGVRAQDARLPTVGLLTEELAAIRTKAKASRLSLARYVACASLSADPAQVAAWAARAAAATLEAVSADGGDL